MTDDSLQVILQRLTIIDNRFDSFEADFNKKIDTLEVSVSKKFDIFESSFNKRIDEFEDNVNDRFILLEAKFINRLDKEIGILTKATAEGFDEVKRDMKTGFAVTDHKIASLQEFYASKNAYRFA